MVRGDAAGRLRRACNASIAVQRLAVKAAVSGDSIWLKLPCCMTRWSRGSATPDEVWQMTDEMLVAQEKMLPRYAGAIDGAKARLAAKQVPKRGLAGCGRLPVRSIDPAARGARPQGRRAVSPTSRSWPEPKTCERCSPDNKANICWENPS